VSGFWRRRHEHFDLEAELRAGRPKPRPDFIRSVSRQIGTEGGGFRAARVRIAFAGGLTVVFLGVLASVGGLGQATTATQTLVGALAASDQTQQVVTQSPGQSQYIKPGKGCGDTNHEHDPKPGTGSDKKPCPVQAGSKKAAEGNSGLTAFTSTVSIAGGFVPVSPLTVLFLTQDGTASVLDYNQAAGVVAFDAGETSKTVTVNVIGDAVKEANETFYVKLVEPSANATIVEDTGTDTIQNDD
jgi:hypothetical protein